MPEITSTDIQDQILGLQRTQATEVWIRKDILLHILGKKEGEKHIIHTINMNETPRKVRSLVEARRQQLAIMAQHSTLVCIDREPTLGAILQSVKDDKDSPQKRVGRR